MAFDYGSRKYSEGNYGGRDDPFLLAGDVGVSIEVYDTDLALKGIYQTGLYSVDKE